MNTIVSQLPLLFLCTSKPLLLISVNVVHTRFTLDELVRLAMKDPNLTGKGEHAESTDTTLSKQPLWVL